MFKTLIYLKEEALRTDLHIGSNIWEDSRGCYSQSSKWDLPKPSSGPLSSYKWIHMINWLVFRETQLLEKLQQSRILSLLTV